MNRSELIAAAADRAGVPKADTAAVLEAALDLIGQALARGETVQLPGFGTFEPKDRAARVGRDLQNGTQTQIPATRVPSFRPSPALKEKVSHKE